jgi:hypothetical protein
MRCSACRNDTIQAGKRNAGTLTCAGLVLDRRRSSRGEGRKTVRFGLLHAVKVVLKATLRLARAAVLIVLAVAFAVELRLGLRSGLCRLDLA